MISDLDKYKIRIEGAQEAIKRSRLVFLIITIASLAIIIATWNAYFSWNRGAILDRQKWAENEVTRHAEEKQVESWVDSRLIDVSLIGIKIGISDAAPLGGLTLFVLSIWFFLSARRQNRAIGFLLKDSCRAELEIRQMIFYGVSDYLVFLTLGSTDDPIRKLETSENPAEHPAALRLLIKSLFFLAPLALVLLVIADILSVCLIGAPFREGHLPLLQQHDIPAADWVWIIVWDVIALLLALSTGFMCWRALKFEEATGEILNEYALRLKS
jgi:hypothetical protein